jgi:hypothetical protein
MAACELKRAVAETLDEFKPTVVAISAIVCDPNAFRTLPNRDAQ